MPSLPAAQPQSNTELDELDDVVTPELPPADASAPRLPDFPPEEVGSPETPPPRVIAEAESPIAGTQGLSDQDQTHEPAPPFESPEDPLANQRPLFDREELEMQYDQYKALLETEQASDAEDEDEDYEQQRLRKLRANDALLAQLGLAATTSHSDPVEIITADAHALDQDGDEQPEQTHDTPARRRGRPAKHGRSDSAHPSDTALESRAPKRKKYPHKARFAEDGTTKSAPPKGETFTLGFVDMVPLRNRARNDYVFIRDVPDIRPEDLASWSEDEADEDADADEQDELEADREDAGVLGHDSMGRVKSKRSRWQPDVLPDGTIMSSCHQCRRKTPAPKMKCRRAHCTLFYCQRCITFRYDMDFHPSAPNFSCPRCLGFCNCSICLRRFGFGNMVHQDRESLVAFSQKLAAEGGLDSTEGRVAAILAEGDILKRDKPTPKKRGSYNKADKVERPNPNARIIGPPKRRGRPPKNREAQLFFVPAKIELDLSDEMAEGEVFSQLEEYVLGRLHVARRILKLMAAKQAAMPEVVPAAIAAPKPKLVVKLKVPSRSLPADRTFIVADSSEIKLADTFDNAQDDQIQAKKKKTPNYHDAEKDVWVRSAADYSTSESEMDDLAEQGTDGEEGEDAPDAIDAEFEEGRTQLFAASLHQTQGSSSAGTSRDNSPLTSLDELSDSSDASSRYDDATNELDHQAEDTAEERITSTQGSFETAFPTASLGMPQHMQQLAMAVLDERDGPDKARHADVLRLHEPLAFPTSSGSEAGELGALLNPQPAVGTPVLFKDVAYPDLDDA